MAYASQVGRARVDPSNPQALAVCDRCGIWYNRVDLQWQFDWRGPVLQNLRFLVCPSCYDTPQENVRAIVLPADPVPITQPRVESFVADETNFHTITQPPTFDPTTGIPIPGNTILQDQNGDNMVEQPIGIPADIDENAVQPQFESTHYRVKLSPLSVTANGTDQISVTFGSAHGLSTNAQIAVQGLSNRHACGAYSITVTTATAFTYQANVVIPAGGLLTGSTLMVTALVGLPLGFTQLPQTGV